MGQVKCQGTERITPAGTVAVATPQTVMNSLLVKLIPHNLMALAWKVLISAETGLSIRPSPTMKTLQAGAHWPLPQGPFFLHCQSQPGDF